MTIEIATIIFSRFLCRISLFDALSYSGSDSTRENATKTEKTQSGIKSRDIFPSFHFSNHPNPLRAENDPLHALCPRRARLVDRRARSSLHAVGPGSDLRPARRVRRLARRARGASPLFPRAIMLSNDRNIDYSVLFARRSPPSHLRHRRCRRRSVLVIPTRETRVIEPSDRN